MLNLILWAVLALIPVFVIVVAWLCHKAGELPRRHY